MPLLPSIFLAFDDGSSVLDFAIWTIAAAIWIFSQMAAAKKRKEKKARQAREPRAAAGPPGGGTAPTPEELSEIFKRLSGEIPATPPPAPRAAPLASPAYKLAHKPAKPLVAAKPAATRVQPEVARRLAQARQEATQAANLAEAERVALNAIVPGVQSRSGETRALDTATRHTGAILPRLYAMSMRLAPLPTVPMPGLDRTHHVNQPMRTRLHTRREVRDALIAQIFLQPSKSAVR